ncbi:MAG: nucleotide exchange factor GrpE, partial [Nitrososphaerota archaeon]
DPFLHEAVGYVERDDVENGIIVAEISRGYEYAGRVLKPPRVIVAKRKEGSEQSQAPAQT